MKKTRRIKLAIAIGLVFATATACYSRVPLPQKSTPAATTISLSFTVDEALVLQPIKNLETTPAGIDPKQAKLQAEQASKIVAALGKQMEIRMEADLVKTRIGIPVFGSAQPPDLALTGEFRLDNFGIALDWRLTQVSDGAVVAAGIATDTSLFPSVEPFADDVLREIINPNVNIDGYASTPSRVAPPVAKAAALDPLRSANDGSRDWAVIIGIESYRDELPPATFAENDARAFATLAHKTLGVPEDHIKLLVGNRAGRGDIASALEEWLPRNAVEPGGRVYIFFSGHGAPDIETGDAYLVPWDGDPAYLKTRGYPISALYKRLESLRDQRAFVFLDACFSGVGGRSVLAKGTRPLVPVRAAPPAQGVVSFSAASASEATGAAPGGAHGLFTHHLLAALGGSSDTNSDSDVTLAELTQHVASSVARDARKENREQSPSLVAPQSLNLKKVVLVRGLHQGQ